MISLQRRCKKHRQSQVFSIRAGLTFEKINPEVLFYGTSGRDFMLFGVLPDSNSFRLLISSSFALQGQKAEILKKKRGTCVHFFIWGS